MEKLKATPYGSWQFEYTSTGYQYNESTTHTHVGKCQFISRAMSIRQQKTMTSSASTNSGCENEFHYTVEQSGVCGLSEITAHIFRRFFRQRNVIIEIDKILLFVLFFISPLNH